MATGIVASPADHAQQCLQSPELDTARPCSAEEADCGASIASTTTRDTSEDAGSTGGDLPGGDSRPASAPLLDVDGLLRTLGKQQREHYERPDFPQECAEKFGLFDESGSGVLEVDALSAAVVEMFPLAQRRLAGKSDRFPALADSMDSIVAHFAGDSWQRIAQEQFPEFVRFCQAWRLYQYFNGRQPGLGDGAGPTVVAASNFATSCGDACSRVQGEEARESSDVPSCARTLETVQEDSGGHALGEPAPEASDSCGAIGVSSAHQGSSCVSATVQSGQSCQSNVLDVSAVEFGHAPARPGDGQEPAASALSEDCHCSKLASDRLGSPTPLQQSAEPITDIGACAAVASLADPPNEAEEPSRSVEADCQAGSPVDASVQFRSVDACTNPSGGRQSMDESAGSSSESDEEEVVASLPVSTAVENGPPAKQRLPEDLPEFAQLLFYGVPKPKPACQDGMADASSQLMPAEESVSVDGGVACPQSDSPEEHVWPDQTAPSKANTTTESSTAATEARHDSSQQSHSNARRKPRGANCATRSSPSIAAKKPARSGNASAGRAQEEQVRCRREILSQPPPSLFLPRPPFLFTIEEGDEDVEEAWNKGRTPKSSLQSRKSTAKFEEGRCAVVKRSAPKVQDAALDSSECHDKLDISLLSSEPPQSQDAWRSATTARMSDAASLVSRVLNRLQAEEAQEAASIRERGDASTQEQKRLKRLLKAWTKEQSEVIEQSQAWVAAIDSEIAVLQNTLKKVTHERYARHGDLQVCTRRIEVRSKLPAEQHAEDNVQQSLNRERRVLELKRQELLEREEEIKHYLSEMAVIRGELVKDVGCRRIRMDQVHGDAGSNGVPKAEGEDTIVGIMEAADQLQADAHDLCRRCKESIQQSSRESAAVTKTVFESLRKRTQLLTELRKQMEESISQVSGTIDQAERNLRKQERKHELSGDGHGDAVASSKASLAELRKTRDDMAAELRGKMQALMIETSCKRVTPQSAMDKPPAPKVARLQTSASTPEFHALGDTAKRLRARQHDMVDPARFDLKNETVAQRRICMESACGTSSRLRAVAAVSVLPAIPLRYL